MASPTSSLVLDDAASPSPSLDTLVAHLLAAKRSLSCVEHVFRANLLVTNTRQALQAHTITTARTVFIRNGSQSQTEILDHVRNHTNGIAQDTSSEFDVVIQSLDTAESRLRATLDQLRGTVVERSLRPLDEAPRTLADFVDDTDVQALLGKIKKSIDTTSVARKRFEEFIEALEEETTIVKGLLVSQHKSASLEDLPKDSRSPVPDILHTMEERAQEMAHNLESLVKHFDLCVNAIKHTEGGGAAASQITSDLPEGLHLSSDAPVEPISDEEKKEMLEVLQKDAGEVEEVVADIKDRIAEMEADNERVLRYGDRLSEELTRTTTAFRMLEDAGNKLPGYITQSQMFLYQWDEEKAKIDEYLLDLEGMREFYAGFLSAYDNLIIEVGRRRDVEMRIEKVRQDYLTKIDKLLNEEAADRNRFRQKQGDYLPVDIWPGLMKAPPRYEITMASGDADSIPDISASVIRKAIKRVTGRTLPSSTDKI